MSRTAKDYTPYLFKRLLEFLSPEKSGSLNKQIKIKEVSVDVQERFSKKILINTKDLIPLATGGFAVKMSCESTSSLVLIGSKIKSEEFKDLSDDAFKYSEVFDDALFLILSKEFEQYLNIKSQVSTEYIEDVLDIVSDPNYDGHTVEEFSNFYDPVYVVNIASDSILADNDTMGLVIELSRFVPSLLHCQDMEFINLINGLSKSKHIVDRPMLYDSLTSFYSRHAFLDIYRCLEKLFYFSWMYSLRQEFLKNFSNFTLKLDELRNICEENLLWKSKENQSIVEIFKLVLLNEDGSLDKDNFDKIYNESIFDLETTSNNLVDEQEASNKEKKDLTPNTQVESLANKVYMYRNSLVHHEDKKYKDKVKKLSDKEWQVLANSVAYFLLAFIQKFDNTLEEQS
jgi:hypothetical protein